MTVAGPAFAVAEIDADTGLRVPALALNVWRPALVPRVQVNSAVPLAPVVTVSEGTVPLSVPGVMVMGTFAMPPREFAVRTTILTGKGVPAGAD